MDLSHTYKPCAECNGTGTTAGSDEPGDVMSCAACDGEGRIAERRTNAEIARAHIRSMESYLNSAGGDGNSDFYHCMADAHRRIADTYLAVELIEATRKQTAELERIGDRLDGAHNLSQLFRGE